MPRIGVGMASAEDPKQGASEAVGRALQNGGLARAEAALLFATSDCGSRTVELIRAAGEVLGTPATVGATAHGVLAGGHETHGGPAVAVVAFSGFETCPFLVPELRDFEDCVASEITARLGGSPSERDLIVLFPDPASLHPSRLFTSLHERLAPARLVGAGAAPASSSRSLQWCGSESTACGLAGLVLRSSAPPRISVTQSCRPVTSLLTVTRTRGHWIMELDGRPALDVYREVARGPLAADLRRAAAILLVALPENGDESLREGRYVVRNVAGFAEGLRAFAVAQSVRCGDRIALALRDAEGAREDLKRMLHTLEGAPSCGGLYFSCCARGRDFFGVPGLEAAYLQQALDPAPVGGMFGSCEIGPLGATTRLLTYTGVLALLAA